MTHTIRTRSTILIKQKRNYIRNNQNYFGNNQIYLNINSLIMQSSMDQLSRIKMHKIICKKIINLGHNHNIFWQIILPVGSQIHTSSPKNEYISIFMHRDLGVVLSCAIKSFATKKLNIRSAVREYTRLKSWSISTAISWVLCICSPW